MEEESKPIIPQSPQKIRDDYARAIYKLIYSNKGNITFDEALNNVSKHPEPLISLTRPTPKNRNEKYIQDAVTLMDDMLHFYYQLYLKICQDKVDMSWNTNLNKA